MVTNMAKSIQIIETQHEVKQQITEEVLQTATDALENARFQNEKLQESISRMDLYMDSRGWSPLQYAGNGPTLEQVKSSSTRIRDMVALNVHVKQGLRLRTNYVLQGGVHYGNIPKKSDKRSKAANVQELMDSTLNNRYFFGQTAREEREFACYADGLPLYRGDEATKTLRPVPISEITADYRNPDQDDEIWAYRRSWQHYPQNSTTPEIRNRWYFTNAFWDQRVDHIRHNGELEQVSPTERIFGQPVNSAIGWAYGVPDALAAVAWAEQYRLGMLSGIKMTTAMAQIWATYKSSTQTGSDNTAMKLGTNPGAGGIAGTGQNGELTPLSTAGQGYKFDTLGPVIASFAAGIGVSKVALTADPSAAGSSYGSAKTLELPEKLAALARREYHIELDTEVLKWLGADDPQVWFDPIVDPSEAYRSDQTVMLRANSGVFTGEETKKMFLANDGQFLDSVTVPEGYLLPNNKDSLARKDIDTDSTTPNPTTAAPDQGSGNGSGGAANSNDIRNDGL